MVFSNTTENTTEVWFIVEKYVQIPLRIPLKSDLLLKSMFRYHWEYHWNMIYHWVIQWYWAVLSNTIANTTKVWFIVEKYIQIPLRLLLKHVLSLSSTMVLNGILKYHWEYHWNMFYHWVVQWYLMVFYFTTGWSNGPEWYYELPFTVPLSPTEIPLNSPKYHWAYWNTIEWSNGITDYHWEYHWVLLKYHWMVQWYSMVFNGIPLALFCKGEQPAPGDSCSQVPGLFPITACCPPVIMTHHPSPSPYCVYYPRIYYPTHPFNTSSNYPYCNLHKLT